MLFPFAPRTEPTRVVVTGAGIVTALGCGWRAQADGFRVGRSAFAPVALFDVSRQRVRQAAQVELGLLPSPEVASARASRRWTRGSRLLHAATAEAWHQAGWQPSEHLPFVVGTTSGGMEVGESFFRHALPQGRPRRHGQTSRAVAYQAQRQVLDVAEVFGIGGPLTVVSTACASGADAVG